MCPRKCGTDRTKSRGLCGCGADIVAARTMIHMWEEPCISGRGGSGAIFFCGCPLGCSFCQNYEISRPHVKSFEYDSFKTYSQTELAEVCLKLEEKGAHNINFVSPSQYSDQLIGVVKNARNKGLSVPIVWNTGGYELRETISSLDKTVNIFLTDVKFCSKKLSKAIAGADDYYDRAVEALEEMLRITGAPKYDESGIMKSGVIVRHLVLPGCRRDSIEILRNLEAEFGAGAFVLSLMNQYTPDFFRGCSDEKLDKALRRRTTSFEYNSVADEAASLGFDGYLQDKTSASSRYTPKWGVYE